MFVDIDLPPKQPPNPLALLGALFGQKSKAAQEPAELALEEIRKTAARFSGCGIRVYRTFNGYRLMIANLRQLPDSPQAQELLQAFRTDPLYVRMCKNQQCFRARLTPKAWRCKIGKPPARFPFADPGSETEYRRWEKTYNEGTRNYCTCQLTEIIGPDTVDPALAPLVQIHDQLTKAESGLALA